MIGGAASPAGLGYWLISSTGSISTYGDALNYGSPHASFGAKRIKAFAATPDGQGYWAVAPSGHVYNYGDAQFCGSAIGVTTKKPVVAIAPTPEGGGYWLVTSHGDVQAFGDAPNLVGTWKYKSRTPIVAIASTPDGNGYWLANAKGAVYTFGDARFFGSVIHRRLAKPVVSLVSTADGLGYWLLTGAGRIYFFGDAPSHGSDLHHPPTSPTTVVGMMLTVATTTAHYVPLPHQVIGYDISGFQCSSSGSSRLQASMPPSSQVTVIQTAGWLDGADNSCLTSEAKWATGAAGSTGASYQLYLFLNSPGTNSAATRLYANGPKGGCGSESGTTRLTCIAYNYGYNGALSAVGYANSKNVHAVTWWVDIENDHLSPTTFSNFSADEFWSGSKALNAETIQGVFDALRASGLQVGIYSSSLQYTKIAGNYSPGGTAIPLWVAGAPWTKPPYSEQGLVAPSVLTKWCAGTAIYLGTQSKDSFAGGVPWILQETPGTESSPFSLDPDYTC